MGSSQSTGSIKRICEVTGQPFEVDENEQFLLQRIGELNPALKGKTLPLPKVHPFENLRQIYSYGGLRALHQRKSAISGAPTLSRFALDSGTQVCTYDEFFTDAVDNTHAGRAYDFSRPFFEQWRELLGRAVLLPLNKQNCEDSHFVNAATDLRRCYLTFAAHWSEDCIYGISISHCRDCIDCAYCKECELCYASHDLLRCYEVQDSRDCWDSQNLFGCYDCRSCHDCYGSYGLRQASYHVMNQPLSEAEYKKFIAAKALHLYSPRLEAREECRHFIKAGGHRAVTFVNCSSASGAHLWRCEDVIHCYNGLTTRNSGYLGACDSAYYCYRGTALQGEYSYMLLQIQGTLNAYSYSIFGGEANMYSLFLLQNCAHCFGCIGLRRKSYCVLNKQYTKEEYLELVPRVIAQMQEHGEWGRFLPPQFSPQTYQESMVHEFLAPISLENAKSRGYRVVQNEAENRSTNGISAAADLGEELKNGAVASLLNQTISCERSGRLFKFQKAELLYYLRLHLPLPRRHWAERLQDLVSERELIPAV